MDKKIVIIGNKPYKTFPLTPILDSFTENVRCNMGTPGNNNGTVKDKLALCGHLYDNLIHKPISPDKFIEVYKSAYIEHEIEKFIKNFSSKDYNTILGNNIFGQGSCNNYLKTLNCPYRFKAMPRTGYSVIFHYLSKGYTVYISNWSIKDEIRESYYVQPYHYDTECHDKTSELQILRWLHKNNIIDASLCLLEDKEKYSFIEDELKPTPFILDKLNTL